MDSQFGEPGYPNNIDSVFAVEIAATDKGKNPDPTRGEKAQGAQHRVVQIAAVDAQPEDLVNFFIVERLALD
jgi:hypothetical protein